jgi:dTDP-4-amino-4,6-dideoxygalactose transaminase
MIPFVDLRLVSRLVADAVTPRWQAALDGCEFVGGPTVQRLEGVLANACGTSNAVACANGTDALLLALQAAGVGPGDHVALPNLTFWATFEAVAQLGAIPVLIDVDPTDLQLDLGELRRAHDVHRFRHVVVVHLYGWASHALAEMRTFCRERDIFLLEDAAQAMGVRVSGQPVLAGATAATLSFYPAKVIGGCMDGGAVLTSDATFAARVRSLANHGRAEHYAYSHVGWNSRMSGLQAHYLLEMMTHADVIVAERRRLVTAYRAAFEDGPLAATMRGAPSGVDENGYLVVLECVGSADDLVPAFGRHQIGVGRTYPQTMDAQVPARGRFVAVSDLVTSRDFVRQVLNLPLYFGMNDQQLERVVAVARELVREGT